MVVDAGFGAVALLVGRIAFGGFLAFSGLNHFTNAGQMSQYAEAKGVPLPSFGVVATGVMLIGGGLGIVLGAFPVLAAGALAVFFVGVTPLMHDFWAVPDDQQQDEMTQFTKNAELFGASLVFLALGDLTWGYALNVGLF